MPSLASPRFIPLAKLAVCLASLAAHALVFPPAYARFGTTAITLTLLPIIVGGGLFGWRGGLLTALSAFPLNVGLFTLVGRSGLTAITQNWIGAGAGLLSGLLVGTLSDTLRTLRRQARALVDEHTRLQQEIAERQRAEAALKALQADLERQIDERTATLRDNEARYRTLVEGTPYAIGIHRDGRWEYVNAAAVRLMGAASSADLLGQPVLDILHPDSRTAALRRMAQVVEARLPAPPLAERLLRADGAVVDVEVTSLPYMHEGRAAAQVIVRDITAARRTEAALRASERLFRQVTDNMLDMIMLTDAAGVVTWVSPSIQAGLGYRPDDWIGRPALELVHPDDQAAVRDQFEAVIASGQPIRATLRGRRADGDYLWLESVGTALLEDGRVTGLVVGSRDIDDRIRVETAEHEQRRLAEALRDTAALLNSSLDYDEVLNRILDTVGQVSPYDTAAVLLVEAGTARIATHRGYVERNLLERLQTLAFTVAETANLQAMLTTRAPLVIPDTRTYPGWIPMAGTQWIRSFAGAPIYRKGDVVGFLTLDSATPHFFTPAHAERLQAFADQAAVAMENARLFADAQQRLGELTLLHTASQALNASLDLEAVLDTIADRLLAALNAETCTISLWDTAADSLTVMLDRDPVPALREAAGSRLPVKDFPHLPPLLRGSASLAIRRDDPALDPGLQSLLDQWQWAALLALPLHNRGQVIGLLELGNRARPRTFTPDDVRLAESLANQAATALRNAELFESVQRQTALLAALYRASLVLLQPAQTPAALAAPIARALAEELRLAHCGVWLLDETRDHLWPAGADGSAAVAMPAQLSLLGPGLTVAAVRTGEVVYAPDVRADPRYLPGWPATRSELALPLKARDQVIGVLDIESPHLDAFDAHARQALGTFADYAALALESARLQASERRRSEALARSSALITALSRVAARIQNTVDPDQVLETLGAELSRLGVQCLVAIRVPEGAELALRYLSLEPDLHAALVNLIGMAPADFRFSVQHWPIAEVVGQQRPVYVSDAIQLLGTLVLAGRQRDFAQLAQLANLTPEVRAAILPLLGDAQVTGLLFVWGRDLEPDDVRAFSIFASHVAVALNNAHWLTRLELARNEAVQASRLKDEFLANVSHELRTPLTAILGSLRLVLDKICDSPEEEQSFVAMAYQSGRNLLTIINDVLDIAKIESGHLAVHPLSVPVLPLLEEVCRLHQAQAQAKGIGLELCMPAEAPAAAWADPDRLRQILLNLVGNAVKFTEAGRVQVWAEAAAEPGHIRLIVRDTGIGIAPEKQAQLFQPFVQADGGSTRRYGGTGLGLSISRRLAERMAGTLTLHSAGVDQGCTLTLTLPAVDDQAGPRPVAID